MTDSDILNARQSVSAGRLFQWQSDFSTVLFKCVVVVVVAVVVCRLITGVLHHNDPSVALFAPALYSGLQVILLYFNCIFNCEILAISGSYLFITDLFIYLIFRTTEFPPGDKIKLTLPYLTC